MVATIGMVIIVAAIINSGCYNRNGNNSVRCVFALSDEYSTNQWSLKVSAVRL